eukprot:CAMPEP_0116062384 /NCGR_PEP_ID=MMETSP0322-20121206/7723_1 /TAXON_ID=163516 /ORGANISM="Leptocylindrus danicus var. apora, Strain B651" /LENGTH=193 /DNA_ID=CAMNT_0003547673 /DNA_START=237 /DNA_END=816 /DNA_ORIENTATION=+
MDTESESSATCTVHWADQISKVVDEIESVDDLSLSAKSCIWYSGEELHKIEKQNQQIVKNFKDHCEGSSFRDEELNYVLVQGDSLRGLEPYEKDMFWFQLKVQKALQDTLGHKSKALKTSQKRAKEAYNRGLDDEETLNTLNDKHNDLVKVSLKNSKHSTHSLKKSNSDVGASSEAGKKKKKGFLRKFASQDK